MTDISFAPAKLPVIATFTKALRISLKSGGPLLRFYLLFLALYVVAAILVGVIAGLVGTVVADRLNLDPGSPGFLLAILALAVPGFLAILVVALRFGIGLTRLADAACEGRTLKFAEVLRNPRPNLLVYVGLTLSLSLMTLVGLLALIVPGLMVVMAFGLAPIAMILEDLGIGNSLTRSRELTRGNRWRFFALYLLAILVSLPISIGSNLGMAKLQESGNIPAAIALGLASLLVTLALVVFQVVLFVVIFRELRALKDGPAAVIAAASDPHGGDDGVPA